MTGPRWFAVRVPLAVKHLRDDMLLAAWLATGVHPDPVAVADEMLRVSGRSLGTFRYFVVRSLRAHAHISSSGVAWHVEHTC